MKYFLKKICKHCNDWRIGHGHVGYANFETFWADVLVDEIYFGCSQNCPFILEHTLEWDKLRKEVVGNWDKLEEGCVVSIVD